MTTPTTPWSWRDEPELMRRLADAQMERAHQDITTIVGCFTARDELVRHVERYAPQGAEETAMTTWTNADGHVMTNLTDLTGPEFDQRHPDARAWRAAGRPDYGFRAWQQRAARERGLTIGEDYEAGLWTEYAAVRAWCFGTLRLDGVERAHGA